MLRCTRASSRPFSLSAHHVTAGIRRRFGAIAATPVGRAVLARGITRPGDPGTGQVRRQVGPSAVGQIAEGGELLRRELLLELGQQLGPRFSTREIGRQGALLTVMQTSTARNTARATGSSACFRERSVS